MRSLLQQLQRHPVELMRNHTQDQQLQRHPVELTRNHTQDQRVRSLSVLGCGDTPLFTAQVPAADPNGHCVQISYPQVTEKRGWPPPPLQPASDLHIRPSSGVPVAPVAAWPLPPPEPDQGCPPPRHSQAASGRWVPGSLLSPSFLHSACCGC